MKYSFSDQLYFRIVLTIKMIKKINCVLQFIFFNIFLFLLLSKNYTIYECRKYIEIKLKEHHMKTIISTDKAPAAIGPYSQAVKVNDMVFTSGIIPVDPATGEIAEGVEAQANQAFKNLSNLLEASGSSMADVIKTTVFIKNMNDFGTINEIYSNYFEQPYPSRSCVEVARLPKDVLLEIEAVSLAK